MIRIQLVLIIAASLLSSSTLCMERQLSLPTTMDSVPSELFEQTLYYIASIDAQNYNQEIKKPRKTIIKNEINNLIGKATYNEQNQAQKNFIRSEITREKSKAIKDTRRKTKREILENIYRDYYSFSPSFQNFYEVFPTIILTLNKSNPLFLSQLRMHFSDQLNVTPSTKFIHTFLNRFSSYDNDRINHRKMHEAFYALIIASNFKDLNKANFEIHNVPLGASIISLKYPNIKTLFPARYPKDLSCAPFSMDLGAFLYNPYINYNTKINSLEDMLLQLSQEQHRRLENLKTALVNPKRTCHAQDKNLCNAINYLFSESFAGLPSWLKPGRRLVLFYYILHKLYFKEGVKNRGIENPLGFFKHQIEKQLNIKEYEITDRQFIYYNKALTETPKSLVPQDSLLKSIFKTHETSDTLTVFTYYQEYCDAIEQHMKDLKDDAKLFFLENFNVLVKHAPNFKKIYQKDFKKFVHNLKI